MQPAPSTDPLGAAKHSPALPCLASPREDAQPLPASAVGVVDIGIAFLREVIEEDRGVKVLTAHLCELQGPLAGHLGLQGAAGLQEAVHLAKQASCPLQPRGKASGQGWASGLPWDRSHGRDMAVPMGRRLSLFRPGRLHGFKSLTLQMGKLRH